jgi:hypothetical protein
MNRVRHLRRAEQQLGPPRHVRARLGQIVYIARQETLDEDWERIKPLLGIPLDATMPTGAAAHRSDASLDKRLDGAAVAALRQWYAPDYELLEYCEELRAQNGWGPYQPRPASRVHELIAGLRRR